MPESNGNFFSKIKSKITEDIDSYLKIKIEVSKVFFSFTAIVYFFSYLCIIAGFQKEIMGLILMGIFPLFVFGTFALLYDISIYQLTINTEKVKLFKIPLLVLFTLLFLAILAFNYGLKF